MSDQEQTTTRTAAKQCYRHPDRTTLVTCGRCGRPLCPDCMRHGPVGVRCAECLRPPRFEVQLAKPERVKLAIGIGIGLGMLFTAVLSYSALFVGTPNWLLSGVAGGVVGWTIWQICGRSSNRQTVRWSVGIGLAMPLLAGLVARVLPSSQFLYEFPSSWLFALRMLAAMGISAFFAWALVTARHWKSALFDR